SWGSTWAKPYRCLFRGPAACLPLIHGVASPLCAIRMYTSRKPWSPPVCCMSDRPGGPECTHGARASSSASTLAQPRRRPYGVARRWGPWQ
ncbi:hypothetical protein TGAM01_v207284, partial [Trichoderma gamsii]